MLDCRGLSSVFYILVYKCIVKYGVEVGYIKVDRTSANAYLIIRKVYET